VQTEREKLGKKLDPKLRDCIRRTIVPILVRSFLEAKNSEKEIAPKVPSMALCEPMTSSSAAESVQ
jgi:hypothetical protein